MLLKSLLHCLPGVGRFAMRSESIWDESYRSGRWDYLHGLDELAHYSVIAGYIRALRQGARVLDLGCGDGILHCSLEPSAYSTYTGVDLSYEAIIRARRGHPQGRFVHANLDEYVCDALYDIIVFNESLYYLPDPAATLSRYSEALAPLGLFIISMYLPRHSQTWRVVDRVCETVDQVSVRNRAGTQWIVRLAAPRIRANGSRRESDAPEAAAH